MTVSGTCSKEASPALSGPHSSIETGFGLRPGWRIRTRQFIAVHARHPYVEQAGPVRFETDAFDRRMAWYPMYYECGS